MKKKILLSLTVTLVVLLAAIGIYINYIAPGITGYAAKNLASGVFLSGRTQQSIEREDISFFPVKYSRNSIDFDNKTVTSRFLIWKARAVYNEGLGVTLVKGYAESEVEKLFMPELPEVPGDPDTIPWPAGDLLSDTVPSGIDVAALNTFLDSVFADTVTWKGTFAVTVAYRDQLVAEKHRSDFTPDTRFLSWSMAKSVTNAMTGIMVRDSLVDINRPLGLPEWSKDDRSRITLNNLLLMNSGLEFNEEYSTFKLTDATTMLLKHGDMGGYAASRKLVAEPGTVWSYSSGSPNIIEDWLRAVIGDDRIYHAWPRVNLFDRLGMRSAVWEVDASGTFVGSSYLYATMRDYTRFGLLYLHDGNWLGEQILPEGWVKYTSAPTAESDGEYGALFWVNCHHEFPNPPEGLFYCRGYDGQRIFIVPSLDLVVVRTGCTKDGIIDWQKFLDGITRTIAKK